MVDEIKVESARALMGIANDGNRSAVERVVAFDMACDAVYKACKKANQVNGIAASVGIDTEAIETWGITETFLRMGVYSPDTVDSLVKDRARSVVTTLFPEIAKKKGGGCDIS